MRQLLSSSDRFLRDLVRGRLVRAAAFRLAERRLGADNVCDLEVHVRALLEWLLTAQAATPDAGVAESYDVLNRRWNASYPETTGYIICSLLRAASAGFDRDGSLVRAARDMGLWLTTVQLPDGGFPGGNVAVRNPRPAVFNTGQIMKGLTDLVVSGYDPDTRLTRSLALAAEWLIRQQDADGAWRRGLSVLATEPVRAYNLRTAWALARYGHKLDHPGAVTAAIRNGEWLMGVRLASGWFPHMNFDLGRNPLLHTVAYTLNGLMELGLVAKRTDFVEAALHAADQVRALQDPATGALPGELVEPYRAAVTWSNTTANSQMAVIWFRAAVVTGAAHWKEAGLRANRFNQRLHEVSAADPGVRGAVRGSSPGHLGYGRYWYMNWTQKFFLDALLAELGVAID